MARLVGDSITLVPINAECVSLWNKWLNDLEVVIPLGNEVNEVINQATQSEAFKYFKDKPVFSIKVNQTGENIGRCLIFNHNKIDRTAMVGIFIGETSAWGQGYGEEAMRLLMDYGFGLLNIESIFLGVYEFNKPALACYKKLGFKIVGRRRQARIILGKKYDIILMDLLSDEYEFTYLDKYLQSKKNK